MTMCFWHVDPCKVDIHECMCEVNPKKLNRSELGRAAFNDQRRRHATGFQICSWYSFLLEHGPHSLGSKAVDILTTLHGESRHYVVNVSQSLPRMHVKKHTLPCLTPGSCMYLMKEGRFLTGRGGGENTCSKTLLFRRPLCDTCSNDRCAGLEMMFFQGLRHQCAQFVWHGRQGLVGARPK